MRSLLVLAAVAVTAISPVKTWAKDFPTRPITILVPYAAGGATDLSVRGLANALETDLGQTVVIDNKTGGSGAVAMAALMRAPADGHTLLIMGTTQITNQFMNTVSYDVARDVEPISRITSFNAGLVVRSESPWKTFPELVAHAKANPNTISYGSSAAATPQHLIVERLAKEQGLKLKFAPFGGGMAAVTALLGGHVQAVSQAPDWKPYVEAGNLRLLVTFGEKRMAQFPDVPTLTELGFGTSYLGFNSVVTRKGAPEAAIRTIDRAVAKVLANKESEFNKIMEKYDLVSDYEGHDSFAKYLSKFIVDTKEMLVTSGLAQK